MNAKHTILVLAAISLVALAGPPAASAQPPWLSGGYPCLYGAWYARGAYWEDLPYFALYPPVYYHGLTPRTYGDSPVWHGGEAWDSQPSGPGPLVVINQFVAQKGAPDGPGGGGPAGPKLIKNPYCTKPGPPGEAGS